MAASFSPSAWEVLRHRYLRKAQSGSVVETPEEVFQRVARLIAAVEANYQGNVAQWEETFFHLLSTLQFLPNSPTLMNAGTPHGQLAACFVLPIEDSLESIFQAVKDMALIHQSGGGTGFSFSHLRPKGDPVASTGGVASGPVSFLRVFDTATAACTGGLQPLPQEDDLVWPKLFGLGRGEGLQRPQNDQSEPFTELLFFPPRLVYCTGCLRKFMEGCRSHNREQIRSPSDNDFIEIMRKA